MIALFSPNSPSNLISLQLSLQLLLQFENTSDLLTKDKLNAPPMLDKVCFFLTYNYNIFTYSNIL